MLDRPRLEITSSALTGAGLRLTTAAQVNVAMRQGATVDQALIEAKIDQISAMCAAWCNLARGIDGRAPTFGSETLRATWLNAPCARDGLLLLPWRAPIVSITSVVENGITLAATDYQLLEGGVLRRLSGDDEIEWSPLKIVVVYVAGWSLPSGVPPELEGQVIEQVKLGYLGTDRDPSLRSESSPDLYQASYGVIGGDSIGESGLLRSLEQALAPFRVAAL